MMEAPMKPRLAAALTLVFAVSATACAHVGQEEFDSEISSLRAELQDRGGWDREPEFPLRSVRCRLAWIA